MLLIFRKCVFLSFMLMFLLISEEVQLYASEISAEDSSALIGAVEDYNFTDYELAAKNLKPLYAKYPDDIQITSTYASSLLGLLKCDRAIPIFVHWRELDKKSVDAMKGHITCLSMQDKQDEVINVLDIWINNHAANEIDVETYTLYATSLSNGDDISKSEEAWKTVLSHQDANRMDKAAAYYYLSYLAMRSYDAKASRSYAEQSLLEDKKGAYAAYAKQLLQSLDAGAAQPFSGSIGINVLYSNNVDLRSALDFQLGTSNAKKSDRALQGNLALNWQQEHWGLQYMTTAMWYATRNDINLSLQRLGAHWSWQQFMFTPYYNYVTFGQDFLFQSGGLDMSWTQGQWTASYGINRKYFNKTYGASKSDLSRLDGVAQDMQLMYLWNMKSQVYTAAVNLHDENTKTMTDNSTTDSYRQAGINLGAQWPIETIIYGVQASSYYRQYSKTSTNATRRDKYLKIAANINYTPFTHMQQWHLLFAISSQRNVSNDTKKTFNEWQSNAGVLWQW
ncbi:MAG: hypothetical protein R8L53_03845 [Mariprofundales bacterium]